jgi:hypothetical protein
MEAEIALKPIGYDVVFPLRHRVFNVISMDACGLKGGAFAPFSPLLLTLHCD